ncbi:hypothetical protein XU18_1715 [Perkinsela sp. CCAP 1560/4]|nr:hypothetical protein XU18_1715 [Perkinsela sp. CCAP 1560/4]|eukprot:KNH07621.1 hypothetical protein XU18_1715 [Perkinsela sp. CCAP 1560/4]
MRRVTDIPNRKERYFWSHYLYEVTGLRKISIPFGRKSVGSPKVHSAPINRDELRKRSVQVLPSYLREQFSNNETDAKSVNTISAEAVRTANKHYRKDSASSRTAVKRKPSNSHTDRSAIPLHPCLLQSPGGICAHDNASGARCPYRNVPRDICMNFLKSGICPNDTCRWLHEDVSVYYARISERSKGHMFVSQPQETAIGTGESSPLPQSQPADSITQSISHMTYSFDQWMHVCQDTLVVCNALIKAPGSQLDLYSLEICLKAEMEPRPYAPGYLLYLVSLHSSLMQVVEGNTVKWKACRLTARILDRGILKEAPRKEEAFRGSLSPMCGVPQLSIQNPLQSASTALSSSGRSRFDAFVYNSIQGGNHPSPTARMSSRVHHPHSIGDSMRQVSTKNLRNAGANAVSQLYQIYWKVLEECMEWDEAWQHLAQLAYIHRLWDECSISLLKGILIPPGLVRHMISLFSSSFHKWQHQSEFLSLFSNEASEKRLPALFSQYRFRILDLTEMSRVYPFMVVQRVDGIFIDCSSFLPRQAHWLAEVVLSRHNGVLPAAEHKGSIEVPHGGNTTNTAPAYFVVREQEVHLFHNFFSELLLRSISVHEGKKSDGRTPREDQSSVRTSPPASVLKYYLLSCLQANKMRLAIQRLRSILLFQSTHHTLPLPLDDVGYALVLKILYRARRLITLWKFYTILMKTTRTTHHFSSRCLDALCTEEPVAPEIHSTGSERAQRVMPVCTEFQNEEREKYFPVCTELMLRYVCQTHEDIVKVMRLVVARTPSKPIPSYLYETAERLGTPKKEIDSVSASNCPPCRFRILRTALERIMHLKISSMASAMFLQYIDWATDEKGYDSQSFQVSRSSSERMKKYRFPDKKEEITTLAEYLLQNSTSAEEKAETVSALRQWIAHHKQEK